MKVSLIASVIAALIISICSIRLVVQSTDPQMTTVDPDSGKAGDVVTVTGENLDKSAVAKLYLTDGTHDIEVAMDEQTATSIKFKIPAAAKPGRLALMVLTTGKTPKLIEQPVKILIEEKQ